MLSLDNALKGVVWFCVAVCGTRCWTWWSLWSPSYLRYSMIPSLYLNCWLYVCCRPAGDPGFYSFGELFTTSPWRQGAHAPQLCVGLIHEHSLTVNSMVTPHAENNSGRSKCFLCWHLTPPRWFFYITPMIHLEVKSLLWVGCSKRLN